MTSENYMEFSFSVHKANFIGTVTPTHLCSIVPGSFHATTAKLSSYNRNCLACEA